MLVAAAIKPRFRVCPARIPPRLSSLKARSDFTPGIENPNATVNPQMRPFR
jgi:hypothetical protein